MSDPLQSSGVAHVRYMTATAPAVVTVTMALLPPLAAFAGSVGPEVVVAAGYGAVCVVIVITLFRLGAVRLATPGPRGACLSALQGCLWGYVASAIPAFLLDVAWLTGHAAQVGPAEERRVFATVALVFGVLGMAAALNLYTFLRSRLWADFRAFVLAHHGWPPRPSSRDAAGR